jgi:hypothetical protein
VPAEGRRQFVTFASVVAVINSVIGGGTIAIAIGGVIDAPLGVAAPSGGAVGLLSLALLPRHAGRLLEKRAGCTEALFPSPEDAKAPLPHDDLSLGSVE